MNEEKSVFNNTYWSEEKKLFIKTELWKFNGGCPLTNTGLWWGYTEKPKNTEEEMRVMLSQLEPKSENASILIMGFFMDDVISKDFMREMMEDWINDDFRIKIEEGLLYPVFKLKREAHSQSTLINGITYTKAGLIKFLKKM